MNKPETQSGSSLDPLGSAIESQITDLCNGIVRGPTSVSGLGTAVRARERILLDALSALVAPRLGGNKREQLSKARSNARNIIAAFPQNYLITWKIFQLC